MSCVSKKMLEMRPSATIEISGVARKLKEQGVKVISLGIGETDFREPQHVDEAAIESINNGETKYPPLNGYPTLKDAIIAKLKRDNSLAYSPEQIIVCNGVKQVLYNILSTTLNPNEEVIIPSPYWVSYIDMVKLAGGKPVIVPCKEENGFKLDPNDFKKAITKKTKWFILNSPSNPTGACYSYEEIKGLTDILLDFTNVHIISDDIYEHIVYDDFKFHTIAEVEPKLYERTLTVNGVSKAYAMTGWRVGYAAGNKEIINAMSILQSQSTSGVCSIAQHAAIAALNGDHEMLKIRSQILQARRDIAIEVLEQIPNVFKINVPQGAFYLFVSCENIINKKTPDNQVINNATDFARYLLNEYQVAVVPGGAFGMDNYFRLSYASDESLIKIGCSKIVEACSSLR